MKIHESTNKNEKFRNFKEFGVCTTEMRANVGPNWLYMTH